MKTRRGIDTQLGAVWNRRLYHWWRYYNEEYLNEALRVPIIALSTSKSEWGRWESAPRRLSIARRHIEAEPWLVVMETLRHEMAHQYADEVLGVRDENPHGAAFRRACEKLRCSPSARARETGPPGEDERILRVLKKVLSLASSPNEYEAQAAVKKAQRLLLEYNLDLVELDRRRGFGARCLGPIKARRASYELWLSTILQEFFFVEVLWVRTYEALADKEGTVLQIYGTPTNLEMAAYVYDYLAQLLERLWCEYRKRRKLRGNRERQRYFAGVLEGFHAKLQEQERPTGARNALVWEGDARLREYYRYLHPRVRTRSGGGVAASTAYRDGLKEGRRVSIHRPLKAECSGFGGYLRGE